MSNHFEMGNQYWHSGDYEFALYSFKDAKDSGEHLNHERPDVRKAYLWNLIGICNYLVSEQLEENKESKVLEALECLNSAIKLVDEEPIYWRNYALLLYWNSKSTKKVLIKAKKAIEASIERFEKIHDIHLETDLYDIENMINRELKSSINNQKIPMLVKIFSKFDKINIPTISAQLKMDQGECLDWLVSLPENLGFVISNNEIKISLKRFNENKYLLEDLNKTITKTDVSIMLQPEPLMEDL